MAVNFSFFHTVFHTMWKLQDFSVIQILREINFRESRSDTTVALNFSLQKMQKFIETKIQRLYMCSKRHIFLRISLIEKSYDFQTVHCLPFRICKKEVIGILTFLWTLLSILDKCLQTHPMVWVLAQPWNQGLADFVTKAWFKQDQGEEVVTGWHSYQLVIG